MPLLGTWNGSSLTNSRTTRKLSGHARWLPVMKWYSSTSYIAYVTYTIQRGILYWLFWRFFSLLGLFSCKTSFLTILFFFWHIFHILDYRDNLNISWKWPKEFYTPRLQWLLNISTLKCCTTQDFILLQVGGREVKGVGKEEWEGKSHISNYFQYFFFKRVVFKGNLCINFVQIWYKPMKLHLLIKEIGKRLFVSKF